jgi:DNA-binding LacI/PurR family transcriptional regulator
MADKKYTIRDISEWTGVSTCTVSRVLSGRAKEFRISDATAQKILAKAREVGYRPNYLAQSLNIGRTFKIGLLFANKVDAFLGEIMEGVEACLRDTDFQMVVATCENDQTLQQNELERMLHRQLDGVIIYPLARAESEDTNKAEFIETAVNAMPTVLVGRTVPVNADQVMFADYEAGVSVAEHFLGKGYSHFTALTQPVHCTCNAGRISGFTETLAAHDVPEEQVKVIRAMNPCGDTLASLADTEAVFAVNSGLLLAFLRELSPERRETLYAVSVGAIEGQELMSMPMHTIKPPTHEMGKKAAETLLWRLDNPDAPLRATALPLQHLPAPTL